MTDGRAIRIATIAVWTLAIGVVIALAFMRSTVPTVSSVAAAGGARPVMYEFSTDT
jgi:hypothetical protein